MHLNFLALIIMIPFATTLSACSDKPSDSLAVNDSLKSQAIRELRNNLQVLTGWEKVHTAEFLVWLGYGEEVRPVYLSEEALHGTEIPYRIGIWRVLAQASADAGEKQKYVNKILEAFKDAHGQDRLHAVETLGKLGVPLLKLAPEPAREILAGELNSVYVYTMWAASVDNPSYANEFKKKFLELTASENMEDVLRLQAAFSLRNLGQLTPGEWNALAATALSEPEESIAGIYLLTAALFNTPSDSLQSDTHKNVYNKILQSHASDQKGRRMEMAYAVAERGEPDGLKVLVSLLNNDSPLNSSGLNDPSAIVASSENADVRSAAAYGVLRIDQRYGQSVEK